MKKTLTLVALMAGAVGGYAQGTIIWSDYVGSGASTFSIDIWGPQPSGAEQIGNSSTDASPSAGSTVYLGQPLGGAATGSGVTAYGNGNAWTIALYASTSSTIAVALTTADEVASSTFVTTGGTGKANILESPAFGGGAGNAGAWALNYTAATTTALPGTAAGSGGSAQVQLAAWYSGGGVTSYGTAVMDGLPAGASEIGIVSGLGGQGASGPPATAPDLAGLGITSFSLATIPEPSTIALGVLGASAFLMRLRRKV
jgi:hypothetical protein